ncbi:SPW repeat protein [Streptomyces sp. NPDC085942]|uniref:SPW repeat domain-containing protein n=1 Tax=Streptomyces sp. NPDC085942 TaxID=3365743 RepID=UPI0037D57B1F
MNSSTPQKPVPPEGRQAVRQGQREQILGFLMLLVSVALFVAPWVADSPVTAKDAHRNELAVGLVVFFVALARFKWRPGKLPDLIIFLAGVWLVVSPWVLSLQNTEVFDGAHVFDVAAGTVLILLAVTSLLLLRTIGKNGAPRQ